MDKDIIKKIRANSMRITPVLKAIFYIFKKSTRPLSIEELSEELKPKNYNPDKTTVYRQMDKLAKIGILEESVFTDSIKRYCLKAYHHHHFECIKCGNIKNITIPKCQTLAKKINEDLIEQGIIVTNHNFSLSGLCKKCNY